ncbi:MAG: efflux RND transporter periplasmic adaptor subunit [candidate division NC10 bacterium]|nr:efflux RND transporter periplasmic adaptor subunit [candidate division NC10 bacterium]
MKKMLGKGIAVLMVLAAGVWAYHANVAASRPAMDMSARVTGAASAFPVSLAPVERGPIRGTVMYTGSVAAYTEEDVYPRVTGRIVEMRVYPGDRVQAGQVVARLDDVELASRVQEAEAMAATTQANRSQTEADVAAARYGVIQTEKELATAEAEAGYQTSVAARDEQLLSKGAISRQEAESSRAQAAAAQARVAAARARIDQAKALEASALRKVDAADAIVTQGQAQVKTAQVVRDYVNIRATTSGYVVKRFVAPGVLVQPGLPVLRISQTDKVRLQANVGEKDLPGIRVGSPVTVSMTGNAGTFTARVTSVFPFIDPGARTAVVEAVVPNDGRRLFPGQYVQMQFVTGERAEVLSVPREAVVRMGGAASVWVVNGERGERREVTTGFENAERVEVLSGLSEGERVVRRGHDGLYVGARVADVATAAPAGGHGGHSAAGAPPVPPGAGRPGSPATAAPSPPARPPSRPAALAPSDHGGHGAAATPPAPTTGGAHGSH